MSRAAPPPPGEPRVAEAVADGILRIRLPLPGPPGEVSTWLLEGDDGWVLVDTGMDTPQIRRALAAVVRQLGIRPAGITHVVLTHAHIDHYGLAGPAREWSGARLVMHAREEILARRFVEEWPGERGEAAADFRATGAPEPAVEWLLTATDAIHGLYRHAAPDERLEGPSGPVPGASAWEWILTPGHSPGHVVLLHREQGVLIAGDHVLPRISPNIGADRYADDPLSDYIRSLESIRGLPVRLVLPSHGEPFEGLAARVGELLRHHQDRSERIVELLAEPRSAFGLAEVLFPGLGREGFLHAVREVAAHLLHLARERRVHRTGDGSTTWRAGSG